LRRRPSVRALAFGPSAQPASRVLGTTEGREGVVQQALTSQASTAVKRLALGVALSSFCPKATVTSMVMAMEKPASHSNNYPLNRLKLLNYQQTLKS